MLRKTFDEIQSKVLRGSTTRVFLVAFFILCLAKGTFAQSIIEKVEVEDSARKAIETDDGSSENINSQEKQPLQSQLDKQPGEPADEMLFPEARKTMEKEGISPEDIRRDPEIRRKLFEKISLMRAESGGKPLPEGDSKAEPKADFERQKAGSDNKGLNRYIDAIVAKNLFHQLGYSGEKGKPSFALTAVISGSDRKAIIEKKGGQESYYVSEGETFADEVEVVDIGEDLVKLDRSGEEMNLKLGEGTESGRGRGRGGSPGSLGVKGGKGESRPDDDKKSKEDSRKEIPKGFDASQLPPAVQEVLKRRGISLEDLRNSPELQRELRREFMQGARRGGDRSREFRMRVPR